MQRHGGGRGEAGYPSLPCPQRCVGGLLMRMFVVSVIGLAGLVSLFVFCQPLRDRARAAVLGQGTMALSSSTSAEPKADAGGPAEPADAAGSST